MNFVSLLKKKVFFLFQFKTNFAKFQLLTKLRINRALKTLSIESELLNSQSILNGLLGFSNWKFILLPCPFAKLSHGGYFL